MNLADQLVQHLVYAMAATKVLGKEHYWAVQLVVQSVVHKVLMMVVSMV
jgi:hypothetical protein